MKKSSTNFTVTYVVLFFQSYIAGGLYPEYLKWNY